MTKRNTTPAQPWLTKPAQKAVRSLPALRRAIEDHYNVTGYTTVNAWLTRRSRKLINPPVLKLIQLYAKMELSEILTTEN